MTLMIRVERREVLPATEEALTPPRSGTGSDWEVQDDL